MQLETMTAAQLAQLKQEGNYRAFAELERHAGAFPDATRYLQMAVACR